MKKAKPKKKCKCAKKCRSIDQAYTTGSGMDIDFVLENDVRCTYNGVEVPIDGKDFGKGERKYLHWDDVSTVEVNPPMSFVDKCIDKLVPDWLVKFFFGTK